MKKSSYCYFYLYFLFLVISSVNNYIAFANDDYKLEQTNQLSDVEKGVFVDAFMDNYKNLPPEKLNIAYKNSSDVKKWLIDTFYEEKEYLEHNQNVYAVCAKILESNKTIGIATFEVLQSGEESIIHIRQIAILPEWQGKNVGTKIYFYIKNFVPNCDRIVVDTRKINSKATKFYQRNGFKLMDAPYDRSLDSNKYCGFALKLKR